MARTKATEAAATAADRVTSDPHLSQGAVDWHIVKAARPNVLITGPADAIELSLAALLPHLDPPVCYSTFDTLVPSARGVKTLVIRNVDDLSARQQRTLSSWLERSAVTRTRLVSTTTVCLLGLVSAGLFLDVLYYRLNTMLIDTVDVPECHGA
jgi:Sigma-54 interaction domain